MFFVENYCGDICGFFEQKGTGRPSYPIQSMICLLLYAYCNKVFSPKAIENHTLNKIPNMVLMDGLTPSNRSISRYRYVLGCYYKVILSKILILRTNKSILISLMYNFELMSFNDLSFE